MAGTLSTPQVGSANSSEDPKIAAAISTLNSLLNSSNLLDGSQLEAGSVGASQLGSDAVTNAKMAADAAIAGSKLDTGDGRLVQKTGLIAASGDVSVTASFQDLTGATVTFTPDVACYALVTAVFVFETTGSGGLDVKYEGRLVVDGVAQGAIAYVSPYQDLGFDLVTDSATQIFRVALTAAEHTLKLQARYSTKDAGTPVCKGTHTNFLYQLVAQ